MVMPGDTRHNEHVNVTIKYSRHLSEDVIPESGEAQPAISPQNFEKVSKWHINRVFYFLVGSSVLCLATVAVDPHPVVQGTVLTIWAGSVGLARFLLGNAYRTGRKTGKPTE
jgi:hypothetical protein